MTPEFGSILRFMIQFLYRTGTIAELILFQLLMPRELPHIATTFRMHVAMSKWARQDVNARTHAYRILH
jgi:hypothetical protein